MHVADALRSVIRTGTSRTPIASRMRDEVGPGRRCLANDSSIKSQESLRNAGSPCVSLRLIERSWRPKVERLQPIAAQRHARCRGCLCSGTWKSSRTSRPHSVLAGVSSRFSRARDRAAAKSVPRGMRSRSSLIERGILREPFRRSGIEPADEDRSRDWFPARLQARAGIAFQVCPCNVRALDFLSRLLPSAPKRSEAVCG